MRLLFAVLLPLLAGLSYSGGEPRRMLGADARIAAAHVALYPDDPARRRAGALTYLGGVRLQSPDRAFGGFSAMRVAGDRFTLVSDGGNIVEFRMGSDWRLREIRFGDLAGPGTGRPKHERDAEALTFDPATGRTWIAFEGQNAIWRYDTAMKTANGRASPAPMARWTANGGAESMVRLKRGGFVVIAETMRRRGQKARAALRFAGDPVEVPGRAFGFGYVPPAGYDPSDMAELPDGRLLVLNRRVALSEWFSAKLVVVDPAAIRPGAAVKGREVATIAAPMTRDNFEAVAVTQERGATIIWLATDDNREWFEKSLLMKFRLDLPRAG